MIKFKKSNKKSYLSIAAVAIIILAFGYYYFHKDIRMIDLPKEEQQPVTALLSNSPTRCVGTYLIDLPVEFKTDKEGALSYKRTKEYIKITTKHQLLDLTALFTLFG